MQYLLLLYAEPEDSTLQVQLRGEDHGAGPNKNKGWRPIRTLRVRQQALDPLAKAGDSINNAKKAIPESPSADRGDDANIISQPTASGIEHSKPVNK